MDKTFREWFTQDYLMQSPIASQLLNGNKTIIDRQERICQVAEMILEKENEPIDVVRAEVAIKYFVTMSTALEYIKYSQLFINEYRKKFAVKNRKV